jgi:16S rRNA (guanine(966)-N(2))-methyltransferase RsmD
MIAAGRVVAGTARGIRLVGPETGVRPLGDRLKQALFAILEPGLRAGPFLDLYAGSGAGGIEALSRGAPATTFVDSDALAVAAIERNLEATHLADQAATIVRNDVRDWLATATRGRFDTTSLPRAAPFSTILVDPPYDQPKLLRSALEAVAAAGLPPRPTALLAWDGVLVAKHAGRAALPERIGLLASARERRFGDSVLTFYRWSAEEAG